MKKLKWRMFSIDLNSTYSMRLEKIVSVDWWILHGKFSDGDSIAGLIFGACSNGHIDEMRTLSFLSIEQHPHANI